MIYLELFWVYFKIGLFTFGGGYAMIPFFREEIVGRGWATEQQIIDYFGICESTPGPFAASMAVLIGRTQGGPLGAVVATIGVILPSFIIILIVSYFIGKFLKSKIYKAVLRGIKAAVLGLLLATSISIALAEVIPGNKFELFEYKALIIFVVALVMSRIKKLDNPILLLFVSALLGVVMHL